MTAKSCRIVHEARVHAAVQATAVPSGASAQSLAPTALAIEEMCPIGYVDRGRTDNPRQNGVPHWVVARAPGPLFDADVPSGFQYRNDFITSDEEASLAEAIARVEFSTFEMRGVVARRRVAFYGRSYDAGTVVTPQLPEFLMPLRERIALWAKVDPHAFAMALINEYPPGAPIGWHRDAPQYGIVAGVSLLSSCRMKFRPYVRPDARAPAEGRRRTATHEILLQRRSAYLMTGESRNAYEHHIPAVSTLRYSITFRTMYK